MEHHLLLVDTDHKPRIVTEIAARDGRTILFARTKHGVDKLVKTLRREGINAVALHGGKAQNARNRAIAAFKDGLSPVLVATDVAARGIHVDDVSLVVHVDPPADPKDYLHRAGRTARAGESGAVVTLVTPQQRMDVHRLTRTQASGRPATRSCPAPPRSSGSPAPVSQAPFRSPKPPRLQQARADAARPRGFVPDEWAGQAFEHPPPDRRRKPQELRGLATLTDAMRAQPIRRPSLTSRPTPGRGAHAPRPLRAAPTGGVDETAAAGGSTAAAGRTPGGRSRRCGVARHRTLKLPDLAPAGTRTGSGPAWSRGPVDTST